MPDAITEPLQNLVIADVITQLGKVKEGTGKSSLLSGQVIAITLSPRVPKSLQQEALSHGECLVYEVGDQPGEGAAVQTQARDFGVMVEIYAAQPEGADVRQLLRRAWAQAAQVICADYGLRTAGVMGITAGDVLIFPDDNDNGARCFCEFHVSLEHLANNPTAAR